MSGAVRKLALDIGFRWLIPFVVLIALMSDYFFLSDGQVMIAMNGGLMFALLGNSARGRIALWRVLPVTEREIGQARWWQTIGLPGIGIVVTMAAALALCPVFAALGWLHLPLRAGAGDILRALLLQFFYATFFTVFSLAVIFAQNRRTPLAYLLVVAVWAPWVLLLAHNVPGPLQDRFLVLSLIGMAAAVILYGTASRWPQPGTQTSQTDLDGGAGHADRSAPSGHGGWLLLYRLALTRALVVLVPVLALYVAAILALDLRQTDQAQIELFLPLIIVTQITQFNSIALRVLRALPGSTHALTSYLFLLPLALLAATTAACSLFLKSWLSGSVPQIDAVALAAVIFASALTLPAALAVSQAATTLVILPCAALIALIWYGWPYLPASWQDERLLIVGTLLSVGTGYFWMHARISKGTRVYHYQPVAPARWRGAD